MHAIIGKVAQDATNIGVSAELRHGYRGMSPLALICGLAAARPGRRYHTFRQGALWRRRVQSSVSGVYAAHHNAIFVWIYFSHKGLAW